MRTDCPPTYETIDKLLEAAEMVSQLPRGAVTEACPVCGAQVIMRNCEVLCVSDVCQQRLIESCSGG